MSNEFDNQISESVFSDKIFNFYKKKKIAIFVLFLLLLVLTISYQAYLSLEKNKHANIVEQYSEVLLERDEITSKDKNTKLENLIYSKNETISLLALNELFKINNFSNKKKIILLDELLQKNTSERSKHLLKIKKSLIIFDNSSEEEMLELLELKNKKSSYRLISLRIMLDYYLSKKENIKANEIEILINEK